MDYLARNRFSFASKDLKMVCKWIDVTHKGVEVEDFI